MQYCTPQIIRDSDQLRRVLRGWRGAGTTVALAPVVGGIHDGHLGVLETAKRQASRVVVSFFGDPDVGQATLLNQAECDLIFAPESFAIDTSVATKGTGLIDQAPLDQATTRFVRLINQVQPDIAVFGEKDWQQLVAIRQVVRDLSLPVGIVSAPTVREDDGLTVSTRNGQLTAEQRVIAPVLHKVLSASAGLIARGNPVDQVTAATERFLSESGFDSVHYVSARRAHDLAPVTTFDPAKPARFLAAVQLGRVRLTDNVPITHARS